MYRCKTCKNSNVQEKAWVDVNTGKFGGLIDEEGECWCDDCEEYCEIYDDELKDEENIN